MTANKNWAAIAAMSALLAAGCSKPAATHTEAPAQPKVATVSLPADPGERAATCYAARVAQFGGTANTVPVEEANEAAHFLFLGASGSGITEPSKVEMLQKVAQAAKASIQPGKQAQDYLNACRQAYPAVAKRFSGLPADGRDARMQCYTLATAMTQIYDHSPQLAGDRLARTRRLARVLDDRITAELNPGGRGNPAELAGLATRSLAVAISLGPITDVLDACAERYAGSAT
ncbi:hypothetical protein ACFSCW_02860 [Sphingomonas tabacisoli]|uniref:Lipoprotein n=1 Tax=Sphingomonas tabacisoli TaxID=2249466 RepID=A0ABW4HYI4_9SPHN